jgi:peptidoglycan hydrolase-like protein with peptidoglycan-binding domain
MPAYLRPASARRLLRTLILATALIGLLVPTPAAAFPQAFFPTQSAGNRGADVAAIQHLLRQHGGHVGTSGVFGRRTTAAVKAFQRRSGLAQDGVVGPRTWEKLVVPLHPGSRGEAVRALQLELNAKRGAGLHANGHVDGPTQAAIRRFQEHAGLQPDGVVGRETWENLVWHYDRPNFAPASLCSYSTASNGLNAKWGTAALVGQFEAAARAAYAAGAGPAAVGDIALEHGGPIVGHDSHRVGLDLDVRFMRKDRRQCTQPTGSWSDPTYDRAATRQLVRAIRAKAPGHVKLILFNDPELIREGLTTHWPNHDDHLHIRYCEQSHPDPLYAC